jgi:hypothetical protein
MLPKRSLWLGCVAVLAAGCGDQAMHAKPVSYLVRRAPARPALQGHWDGPAWRAAPMLKVERFMAAPGASDHRPGVQAKVTYTADGLCVIFRVSDRYVVCRHTEFQSSVYKDSCVEFFVQPKPDKGYFNFEMNAGGALLVTYIEDAARTPAGFKKFTELPPEANTLIPRYHSFTPPPATRGPRTSSPEVPGPVEWCVEYFVPFSLLERYVGPLGNVAGQTWRANFFKCADESSHPHWASWAPLDADFAGGFHRPDKFGELRFE